MKTALASVLVANHIYRALHKSTAPPTECVMDLLFRARPIAFAFD